MNLILYGVTTPPFHPRQHTGRERDGQRRQRHDVVLTNPPFGGHEGAHPEKLPYPRQRHRTALPATHPQEDSSRHPMPAPLWLCRKEHCFAAEHLLSQEDLLDAFHLFAVISLPPGTFSPYSDVKTALLFFRRAE